MLVSQLGPGPVFRFNTIRFDFFSNILNRLYRNIFASVLNSGTRDYSGNVRYSRLTRKVLVVSAVTIDLVKYYVM